MLKNQHRYAEISADRSIPIPLQPPHLLHFDILNFPDQKEILTLSSKVSFVFFKFYISCETIFADFNETAHKLLTVEKREEIF